MNSENQLPRKDPRGVLGYKHDGGVRRSLIFCTQKNTWTLYCAPKKKKTASDESYCVRKDTDDRADDKFV